MRRTALASQLLARKSIDKLIRDSEEPEHSLKKTLGPWSLTALGIGAVIGSGIFTVIGTAMAGQKFDTPNIRDTPLMHYLSAPHRHGRPAGRGPGAGALAGAGGHRLRLHRTLLCRTGLHDSHRRLGLHLYLRHAGRAGRLDHRLGSDSGIRLQQHERERGLCRPYRRSVGLVRLASAAAMDLARLSAHRACRISPATISTSPAGTSASTFPPFWW